MKIGIDIRALGNNRSGIEEYTENILANMLSLDPAIQFVLFFSSLRRKIPQYSWRYQNNVKIKSLHCPNNLIFLANRIFNRPYIDKLLGGVDVFFSPHFFLSSLSPNCKRITTFHDLSYLHFPEYFSFSQNIWHKFKMRPKWQAKFSDKIIAVSESTKKDIVKKYDINSGKISVIYSGSSFKRPTEEQLKEFGRTNKLPKKFILFLGKLEPRKNISGIIKAFNIIKQSPEFEDLHLVIGGSKGWLYKEIFKEIKSSPFRDSIIVAGYIKDQERPFYYSLASVFVYPSFFEGFGLPPLEAMSCGTPVVASNNSSLPEVVGDAGLLVDPDSVSEIAFAIQIIINDATLRSRLIQRGYDRSQQFSWNKAAKETLQVLIGATK